MTAVITPESSKVVVARGPRAAEAELLRLVREHAPRTAEDLGQPLRIIVPSASLRRHVVAQLAADTGRPLLGVVVQTLSATARDAIERAGGGDHPAGELTAILIRRRAAAEAVLGPALGGLDDGYGIVEGAVRDLLDSGFEPGHAAAIAEKLNDLEHRVSRDRLARVAGVVKVAAAVALELEATGALRSEQQPQRAAEMLRAHGPAVLPSTGVIVHGFADATGVATDFVHTLLAVVGGVVVLDRPPDPAGIEHDDAGAVFLERFESHLGAFERVETDTPAVSPELNLFVAPTPEAEARQVAHRVRALLDGGAVPESIGVVARELEPELAALGRHFDRLAIPFSGSDAEVPGGLYWRRARLLSEILRAGPDLPAELWLEAMGTHLERPELGLALRTLGVVSLADAAQLSESLDPRGAISLPLPDVDEGEARRGRSIESAEVLGTAEHGAGLAVILSSWPERGPPHAHLRAVEAVLGSLGWLEGETWHDPVAVAVRRLASELPPGIDLGRGEFVDAVRRRLAEVGLESIGGAGGGVQLLTAMEARGRTFDHLFVIAVNRGRFPRVVQEDPLLPDSVRGHLASEVLPEFPVKARGLDEERYLFAQLVASARFVTLSWRATDNGSKAAPSPFVERLRRELDLEALPCPAPLEDRDDLRPRPACEHAILAAEHGDRSGLASFLVEAVLEGGWRAGIEMDGASEWAAGRIEILDAIDPATPSRTPGPWAGLVGATVVTPGRGLPPVTGLENIGRCPWRAFAERRLGIAGMPDPRLGLPDTRGFLLGSVVHEVLQRIVEETAETNTASLIELAGAGGRHVPWPDPERLREMVVAAAGTVVARNGLAATGVAPLLAAQVGPFLEVARLMDWPDGIAHEVVAAEVEGSVEVGGAGRVRFRADRLDCEGENLVLVDYKSAGPISTAKTESTRRDHLLNEVARGRTLQAVAYALATPEPFRGVGRYLSLKPFVGGAPEEARRASVGLEDVEVVAAFTGAVETIVRGWVNGGLPPRVEEAHKPGKTPPACGYCPVAQACLRSDSGYLRRIVAWMSGDAGADDPVSSAARSLWWLGVERPKGGAA